MITRIANENANVDGIERNCCVVSRLNVCRVCTESLSYDDQLTDMI